MHASFILLTLTMSLNLQGKGLRIAHLNICSLRNKTDHLSVLLQDNNIHIMAISETHLDASVMNSEIDIPGYTDLTEITEEVALPSIYKITYLSKQDMISHIHL